MRLEYVCDMHLSYSGEFKLVRPYRGEEGSGYGEGVGTVVGDRLQGHVRWVNHPHRRSDGVMVPDAHGVIESDDGAVLLFTFQGRTVFGENKGAQTLQVTFETEDDRYRWLNDTLCVLEGTIEPPPSLKMDARVYACVNELIE